MILIIKIYINILIYLYNKMSSKTGELININDPYYLIQMETKINLMPHELCRNFEDFIANRLKDKVEGINSREGYIKPNSTIITRRSNGEFRGNHTTGQITFNIEYVAEVCRPFRGDVVTAYVENINKNGLMARKGPLVLIAHKDHENNSHFFNLGINLGSLVKFEIIGSKFQLYEDTINAPCKILDVIDENILIDNNKKTIQLYSNDNINFSNISLETNNTQPTNIEYGYSNEYNMLNKKLNSLIENKNNNFDLMDIYNLSDKFSKINENIYNFNPINNTYYELYEVSEDLDLINSIAAQSNIVFTSLDNPDMSSSEFFLKYREKFNDNEKYLNDKLYVLNDKKDNIKNKYITSLVSEYDINLNDINLTSTANIDKYINSNEKSDIIYCNGYSQTNKENTNVMNQSNLLASYLYFGLCNQKDNGHLILRIGNNVNDTIYKLIMIMGSFYNNIYFTRPNSVKDYSNVNYLVFKNYNYNKTDVEKFALILKDIIKIETKFYDKYDNNDEFVSNLDGVSGDRAIIREINSYNNNVFQTVTKSYSKIIKYASEYPDTENLEEIKQTQNKDALKWISKYIN